MRGLGLVEIMLVIVAISVATVAVVATYRVVDNNRKIQLAAEQAQVISGKLSSLALSSGLANISQERAIEAGVYPTQMFRADGEVRNVWEGEAVITPTPGTTRGATLILANIPESACIKLVQQASPGFHSASVGSIQVSSDYGKVNMQRLVQACSYQQGTATLRFNYLQQ